MNFEKNKIEMKTKIIIMVVFIATILVLGIFLMRGNSKVNKENKNLTDADFKNKISKLFIDNEKVVVYPDVHFIEIKVGEEGYYGFGIKNYLADMQGKNTVFNYNIIVNDKKILENCKVRESEAEEWIIEGKTKKNITLSSNQIEALKVGFKIPETAIPCVFRTMVIVRTDSGFYDSEFMDIKIVA